MVKAKILRIRGKDSQKILSLVNSAEINAVEAKKISLNDNTATLIFREIYESIRQLGDASWWLKGYEPLNHEISLDGLKDWNIKEKVKLNFLSRFKQIRHKANYKGFRVSINQAKEIIDFWDSCSNDIVKIIVDKISH